MKIPTTLIVTRDLRAPVAPLEAPSGMKMLHVAGADDPGFDEVDHLCNDNGFAPGWAAGMLSMNRRAVVAVSQNRAVGCGWTSSLPFFVDEIGCVFTPPDNGDYFCGDFVAPAARGQGLQQVLIRARLLDSIAAGRRWATALMFMDNASSVKNYSRECFEDAAQWGGQRYGPVRIESLHRREAAPPCGSMKGLGALAVLGRQVRWS